MRSRRSARAAMTENCAADSDPYPGRPDVAGQCRPHSVSAP
jgi:hypothetical protein